MIKIFFILSVITCLCSCVSNKYSPELSTLVTISDCREFSGQYVLENQQEEDHILSVLLETKDRFEKVTIDVKDYEVEISGFTKGEEKYSRAISRSRSTCAKSILTLITRDQYSANGIALAAEDQKLQLFSPGEDILSMRLVSSGVYGFYIIPFYLSSDKILNLKKVN